MLTTLRSLNRKLGAMSSTYRSKDSCPVTCALYKVCYSKFGVGNIQFDRATRQGIKDDAKQIFEFITTMPLSQKIRHFVGGDFCRDGKNIDKKFVNSLIKAHGKRTDLQAFGYTHEWDKFKFNPFKAIKSLTFNASCETPEQVKAAKKKGFDTVMVVPQNTPLGKSNIGGVKVLICPNQTAKAMADKGHAMPEITCDKCMLCFKKNRDYTIGFLSHGNSKGKLDAILA